MKRNSLFGTFAAVSLFATLPCSASNANSSSSTLERISIIGARQPIETNKLASISYILTAQDIAQSGQLFLVDILRGMPGISVSSAGGVGSLTEVRLRGSESNHLLVLIDGIVVNDEGQGGLVDFAHITTTNIVRVELLQGPQSALWGNGAVAGVLSITTDQQQPKKQITMGVGSQRRYNLGFDLSSRKIAATMGEIQYHTNIQHVAEDGSNIARAGGERDGYRNSTLGAGLKWFYSQSNEVSVTLRGVDYRNEFDAVDFINSGLPIDANNVSSGQQLAAKLNWRHQASAAGPSHNSAFQYSHNRVENHENNVFSGSTKHHKYRLRYHASFPLDVDGHVNLGAEWLRDEFEQRGLVYFDDPNQTQALTSLATFADTIYHVNDNISVSLSLRYDNNSEFKNELSYRSGISMVIDENWRTFASIGKAVRNPTFTERFGYFPGTFIGNPELTPEWVQNLEFGLEYSPSQHFNASLATYTNKLKDEINGFVYDIENGGFTAANQTTESERRGLEFAMETHLDQLTLKAFYSYIDAKEDSNTATASHELRRPTHSGSVSMTYRWQNMPLSLLVKADYTGTRQDQFFPPFPQPSVRIKLPAYTLVSLNLQYAVNDSATIQLSAANLFNQQYEDIIGYAGKPQQVNLSGRYLW